MYYMQWMIVYTSRRPLPVSPRPPSGIDTSRCWARQCRRTGETPVFCTSVCVCDPRDAAVTCPTRRGCHSCDDIRVRYDVYTSTNKMIYSNNRTCAVAVRMAASADPPPQCSDTYVYTYYIYTDIYYAVDNGIHVSRISTYIPYK